MCAGEDGLRRLVLLLEGVYDFAQFLASLSELTPGSIGQAHLANLNILVNLLLQALKYLRQDHG